MFTPLQCALTLMAAQQGCGRMGAAWQVRDAHSRTSTPLSTRYTRRHSRQITCSASPPPMKLCRPPYLPQDATSGVGAPQCVMQRPRSNNHSTSFSALLLLLLPLAHGPRTHFWENPGSASRNCHPFPAKKSAMCSNLLLLC